MRCALLLLLSAFTAVVAVSSVKKRATCTVQSLNDALADDAPAIVAALDQCGDSGQILFPQDRIFRLRSTVDLSKCRRCDLQLDGTILVSSGWDYWNKHRAVFTLSSATNAIIHSGSGTGLIDANNLGHPSEITQLHQLPALFSITNNSYQIYISNLRLRNVPGTVFHVSSGSNSVRIYSVDLQTPATIGYLVEQAQHVYLWNDTVRATDDCVSILPNSSNVQVENSICTTTDRVLQGGFSLQSDAIPGLSWIRNVLVRNSRAFGSVNLVSLGKGPGAENGLPVEINNVTFHNITFGGSA